MATKKVKATNPVVSKLLDALAELDKQQVVNERDQGLLNAIRSKIEATADYTNGRMPETKPVNEVTNG